MGIGKGLDKDLILVEDINKGAGRDMVVEIVFNRFDRDDSCNPRTVAILKEFDPNLEHMRSHFEKRLGEDVSNH